MTYHVFMNGFTKLSNKSRVGATFASIACLTVFVSLLLPSSAATANANRADFGDVQTTVLKSAKVVGGYVEFGSSATAVAQSNPAATATTKVVPPASVPVTATTKAPVIVTPSIPTVSSRYSGNLVFPSSAPYAVNVVSNGGVRVTLDGKRLIDDLNNTSANKKNTLYYTVVAGRSYPIVVEYKNTSESDLRISWSLAGKAESSLPSGAITSNGSTTPTTVPSVTVPPTTKPAVTTTKALSTTTKAPTSSSGCNSNNSAGVVSHPIDIGASGTQKVWVKISHTAQATLQLSFDNANCITETFSSMGADFMWMPISSVAPNLTAGNKTLTVGSSLAGLKLASVIVVDARINCTPIGDGANCSNMIYSAPVVTNTTSTTKAVTPTTAAVTTTTMMDHTGMGGSSGNNDAIYRNDNPLFRRFASVPSNQLPLSTLLVKEEGDPQWYGPNSPTSAGANGQVRTRCEFSHLSYNDPIIKPNQPGAAHLHMFFGNTATDSFSTGDTIMNSGGSTCDGFEANRTSYWFPAMLDASGNARIPNNMMLYYKAEGMNQPAGGYTEIPSGLKMIAGNMSATSAQPAHEGHGFTCSNMFTNPNSVQQVALIPDCNTGLLSMKVMFPRCWDGSMEFDPANPFKHVTYGSGGVGSNGGVCPSTHPKVFVGLSALFDWQTGGSTAGWKLASDGNKPGGTTIHGDWFGGWNKDVLRNWNSNCINAQWNCQTSLMGANNTGLPGIQNGRFNMLAPTTQAYIGKGPITVIVEPRK